MPTVTVSGGKRKSLGICLEFANTVAWHASSHPREDVKTYKDLVVWAREAGVVSDSDARGLLRAAADRPVEAARALKRARALREAIYRIFAASAHGGSPAEDDLSELNDAINRLTNGARIAVTPEGFAWNWNVDKKTLDWPIAQIALSAADLLTSPDRSRVGQCADDHGCGWLFLDFSKNRTRRWCDAGDCGNRYRQRRFQERSRMSAG